MTKKQLVITFLLLASTVAIHYNIPQNNLTLHVIFRLLYLVPVAYVGLKTGKMGGSIMALIAILLYTPHFLIANISMEFQAGNIVVVILMIATGLISGIYRSTSEKKYLDQTTQSTKPLPVNGDRNILFYVENNPSSQFTSKWFADYFQGSKDISITLLWISVENVDDIFEHNEKTESYIKDLREISEVKRTEVRHELINAGYIGEKIEDKIITLKEKIKISTIIEEELSTGLYDFVLLPKHKMTKGQEFLFGDIVVQLIRDANVPVLSVICDE
jgi:hypothetical protein